MYPHDTAEPTWKSEQDKQPGAIERLDVELERFEKSLAALSDSVGPVSNQYVSSEVRANEPRPEPPTQLHGHVERLRDLIYRLDEIQRAIAL